MTVRRQSRYATILICLVLFGVPRAVCQVTDFPDTVLIQPDTLVPPPIDTSRVDTVKPLGGAIETKSPSGIDSVVAYAAEDSIVYSLARKTMFLYGNASIRYKELSLKAERISINWNTSTLVAEGVPDTSDTSGVGFRGLPILVDGGEEYHGSVITYDFKTKRGKIDLGETEIDEGFYYGDKIKKVASDVLFVADGRYTTCDLDHPHYYFASPEMKVVLQDKIIARPVYLYIDDVPVFALPFGVFPNQRGRRSGLIAPAYGESDRGRYLLHLGYYWAISDYMDWNIRADGYTKGSYVLYSDYRYALRYNFTGSISGSYAKTITGERGDPNYGNTKQFNLRVAHNQEFNPTTRLVVNFTLTSNSYYQNTSYDFNDLLRQNVISDATFSKSWEGTPNSMTINVHRDQNLVPQPGQVEISDIIPNMSFNRAQSFPFRFGRKAGDVSNLQWFELIGYTYSGQFLNTRNRLKVDSVNTHIEEHRGINHAVSVNASPKVGYFTITPFFNYTEKWYDKSIRKNFNPADSSLTISEVKKLQAVRYYDLGISASTKFFGIVRPNIFGIKGIRHQVTPTVSYTYQPDFTKPHFGYFGTYTDEFDRIQRYSFYEQEVFGGAPSEERQSITLRIGNVFEAKTASGDTSEDNKFQLLNVDVATSYNFVRDSLKFDDITVGYRTKIGNLLDIGGSSRFSMYKFEPDPLDPRRGRRVNKLLLSEKGWLAQLTNFNISLSTTLSGEKKKTTAGPIKTAQDSLEERSGYKGLYEEPPPDFSIPWNLQLTWNFSQNQADPRFITRASNVSARLSFNLTEFWKITASANYDLINRVFATPSITVYRDLHCWEMNFSWVPTGRNRNFRLEIRVKAPQLQDVKVTRQSSARGLY